MATATQTILNKKGGKITLPADLFTRNDKAIENWARQMKVDLDELLALRPIEDLEDSAPTTPDASADDSASTDDNEICSEEEHDFTEKLIADIAAVNSEIPKENIYQEYTDGLISQLGVVAGSEPLPEESLKRLEQIRTVYGVNSPVKAVADLATKSLTEGEFEDAVEFQMLVEEAGKTSGKRYTKQAMRIAVQVYTDFVEFVGSEKISLQWVPEEFADIFEKEVVV